MKKLMIAALAALMLAGSLSAVTNATSMSSVPSVAIVGEGSSPIPLALSASPNSEATSLGTRF